MSSSSFFRFHEKIFFFDSDDIMLKGLINVVCEKLNGYDCVKPKFVNFVDKDGQRVFTEGNNLYGEGVFGIRKTIFLGMNGFEGWKMAADSDFMGRIYKHKRKIPYKIFVNYFTCYIRK